MKLRGKTAIVTGSGRDGGGPGAVALCHIQGRGDGYDPRPHERTGPGDPRERALPGDDRHRFPQHPHRRRRCEAAAPIKRLGVPEDVANLVLFLTCDDSALLTGTNIDINGGVIFS